MNVDERSSGAEGFNVKRFLADQLRNIAPVFTLFALVVFFCFASPSFLSLDNAMNIFSQVSITGIIAVGLTFVILTAEIDLSVAAIANAVGITVAYFTLQPDYVNIANIPLNGIIAIVLTLLSAFAFGARHRLRHHQDRHSVLHHDAGHDADRQWRVGAAGARPDRL